MTETMPPPKKNKSGRKRPYHTVLRLDDPTADAFDAYIASLEVAPVRNSVLVAALRRFLAERGFWPLKPKS